MKTRQRGPANYQLALILLSLLLSHFFAGAPPILQCCGRGPVDRPKTAADPMSSFVWTGCCDPTRYDMILGWGRIGELQAKSTNVQVITSPHFLRETFNRCKHGYMRQIKR